MDNLQIGAFGWQNEAWKGEFYPDDLPEEWMLDYYSNMYRTVLVPEKVWMDWDSEQIEEVADAVEEPFAFYFEVQESCQEGKERQLAQIAEEFTYKAAGVVLFSESAAVQSSCAGLPVTLVSKSQTLPGWHWVNEGYTCSGALCGVVDVVSDDAKQQTALLQSYMQNLPAGALGGALLVKTDSVKIKQLFNLKTIGEFLGY